jgi:hypothetical protein
MHTLRYRSAVIFFLLSFQTMAAESGFSKASATLAYTPLACWDWQESLSRWRPCG